MPDIADARPFQSVVRRFRDMGDGTFAEITVGCSIGAHENAWNNFAVAAGGTSTVFDARMCPFISAFGNASAATTITIQ